MYYFGDVIGIQLIKDCVNEPPGILLSKGFWAFGRRHLMVRNQHFGTTFLFLLQGLDVIEYLETLKMEQTSSPKMLVSYHKMTKPEKTQKPFRQHYKHCRKPSTSYTRHLNQNQSFANVYSLHITLTQIVPTFILTLPSQSAVPNSSIYFLCINQYILRF